MRCIIISANKEETKALAALSQFCIFAPAGMLALVGEGTDSGPPREASGDGEAAVVKGSLESSGEREGWSAPRGGFLSAWGTQAKEHVVRPRFQCGLGSPAARTRLFFFSPKSFPRGWSHLRIWWTLSNSSPKIKKGKKVLLMYKSPTELFNKYL